MLENNCLDLFSDLILYLPVILALTQGSSQHSLNLHLMTSQEPRTADATTAPVTATPVVMGSSGVTGWTLWPTNKNNRMTWLNFTLFSIFYRFTCAIFQSTSSFRIILGRNDVHFPASIPTFTPLLNFDRTTKLRPGSCCHLLFCERKTRNSHFSLVLLSSCLRGFPVDKERENVNLSNNQYTLVNNPLYSSFVSCSLEFHLCSVRE